MKLSAKHTAILNKSILFKNLNPAELDALLAWPGVALQMRKAQHYVFTRGEMPEALFVLLSGSISVEKVDINGKRSMVSVFSEPGTVFAEVYLYLNEHAYDYDCRCLTAVEYLYLPKSLFDTQNENPFSKKLVNNMLAILSQKAFYLNRKLLVLGSYTLRQKIANYLLHQAGEQQQVRLPLKREDLADYLGTARPSLSRELKSMQADGLISVERDKVVLCNMTGLQKLT